MTLNYSEGFNMLFVILTLCALWILAIECGKAKATETVEVIDDLLSDTYETETIHKPTFTFQTIFVNLNEWVLHLFHAPVKKFYDWYQEQEMSIQAAEHAAVELNRPVEYTITQWIFKGVLDIIHHGDIRDPVVRTELRKKSNTGMSNEEIERINAAMRRVKEKKLLELIKERDAVDVKIEELRVKINWEAQRQSCQDHPFDNSDIEEDWGSITSEMFERVEYLKAERQQREWNHGRQQKRWNRGDQGHGKSGNLKTRYKRKGMKERAHRAIIRSMKEEGYTNESNW